MEQIAAALAGLLAFAAPGDTLAPYGWQARPILVFADEGDARLERQLAEFAAVAEGLRDRRNVILVDTNAASVLRDRFGPEGFTVVLIGLDGGEKAREQGVVSGTVFDARIDAMPMRRRVLEAR